MNTDQKTRITRLRSEGASYNQIAQELGISKTQFLPSAAGTA